MTTYKISIINGKQVKTFVAENGQAMVITIQPAKDQIKTEYEQLGIEWIN